MLDEGEARVHDSHKGVPLEQGKEGPTPSRHIIHRKIAQQEENSCLRSDESLSTCYLGLPMRRAILLTALDLRMSLVLDGREECPDAMVLTFRLGDGGQSPTILPLAHVVLTG